MTASEALETVERVGSVECCGEKQKLRFPEAKRAIVQSAIETLKAHKLEAIAILSERPTEPTLKGNVVEVFADAAGGTVWIVADEEDARLALQSVQGHRGQIWTRKEIELVGRIDDPAILAELVEFKIRFQSALRTEDAEGNETKH